MPSGVHTLWRAPSNQLFLYGAPYSKWYVHEEKNQHLCIRIYHQQLGLCLMAIDFPVSVPPDNFTMYSDDEDSVSSNSDEQLPSFARDANYLPSTDSSSHKITEGELSDLIRGLELPTNEAELLASRLQQWNLLHHSVKVTKFRARNQEILQFFKTVGYFTYCKDTDGLMDAMHIRHSPEQWRLFIDASKTSLNL